MEPLEFTKGHGTGNDFVIVPDPDNCLVLPPQLVAALCDRRTGIGADGLLRVVRSAADPALSSSGPAAGDAEWFMDYRNADGSVAEMCGNGARVFARYLADSGLTAGSAEPGRLVIGTRSGPVEAVVTDEAVSVTMGAPRVGGSGTALLPGRELPGMVVDCGNPHLVCRLPEGVAIDGLDLTAPPAVPAAVFPDGVNVEFIAPSPEPVSATHIRMRVYERGVGETRSCGSGACAAAAVALRAAGHDSGVVTVDVPGGRLTVALTGAECAMTGPAVLVAHGVVDPAGLAHPGATRLAGAGSR